MSRVDRRGTVIGPSLWLAGIALVIGALSLAGCTAPRAPGAQPPWLGGEHYTMEYSAGAVLGDALDGDHTGVEVQVKVKGR